MLANDGVKWYVTFFVWPRSLGLVFKVPLRCDTDRASSILSWLNNIPLSAQTAAFSSSVIH